MYYTFKEIKFNFKPKPRSIVPFRAPPRRSASSEGAVHPQHPPRAGQEYLSVSVWGPQAGHAGIHGLVPGEQQCLREVHQPHQDSGEQEWEERYTVSLRDSSDHPFPHLSPPHHLRLARCRALLAAGVSRLCISIRKGWGCCLSNSSSDLTSLSWVPSELRARSRSRTIFPAGP